MSWTVRYMDGAGEMVRTVIPAKNRADAVGWIILNRSIRQIYTVRPRDCGAF